MINWQNTGDTALILLSISWILMSGCDVAFNPVQENDKYHFSIFGYLDASADTQWVRVMPVRDSLSPDAFDTSPIEAVVTLEHIQTGESVVMQDSLFSYGHDNYVWNYWTRKELQPGETYKLRVEDSDGKYSQGTVTLPEDYPTPFARDPSGNALYIGEVERLVDVRTIYYLQLSDSKSELRVSFPHLQDTLRMMSGELVVNIDNRTDHLTDYVFERVSHKQIFIAIGGPDFHNFGSIHERIEAIPQVISNIENGVGYLAGIISKTIPYQACSKDIGGGQGEFIPCPLEPYPW